jgi:tripartite ATP-independent transporter DctP family solute receptor
VTLRRERMLTAQVCVLTLIAAVLCGCTAPRASSSIIELKLAHASSPGSLVALSAEEFARRVNETFAGRARIRVFGAGQLGSDEVLLIKLRLGTVDFAIPSTVVSSAVEAFGFFEMPYLVKDRAHVRRIEREIFWPHLEPFAEERGFKILALWEHGFRQITNNRRPIATPEDLQGIKLRTPKGYWRVGLFQAFGANPTPMSLTEVFVALQTGVLDGQENPLQQIYASRFQEVQRFLSLTNHVYSPVYVTVGAEKWASHPAGVRETIERIARETQAYSDATAARMDQEVLAELARVGMQINRVERDRFLAASRRFYEQFADAVPGGRAWIETARTLENDR